MGYQKRRKYIELYKEELLSNNPYKSKNAFLLGDFSDINKLDLSAPISLSWQINKKINHSAPPSVWFI